MCSKHELTERTCLLNCAVPMYVCNYLSLKVSPHSLAHTPGPSLHCTLSLPPLTQLTLYLHCKVPTYIALKLPRPIVHAILHCRAEGQLTFAHMLCADK